MFDHTFKQSSSSYVSCRNIRIIFVHETCSIRDIYYANIGTSDKSSDFDVANIKVLNSNTKGTTTVSHANNWYTFVCSGFGNYAFCPIPKLNGVNSNYKFSAIVKGSGHIATWNTPIIFSRVEPPMGRQAYSLNWNSRYWDTIGSINNLNSNTEYEIQLISNGSNITAKILDLQGNVLGTWTKTETQLDCANHTVYFGLGLSNGTSNFRNLTLELL